VTSEGTGTGPEKEAGIAELEPPSTVKELGQYLGVASWYRRLSTIVKPLNDLLAKASSGSGHQSTRWRLRKER